MNHLKKLMLTDTTKIEQFTNELKKHPKLLEHISHILDLITNETSPINNLNDFEDKVIDELRGFGKDIIEEWALKQSDSHTQNIKNGDVKLEYKGKKKSVFTQRSGT